MKSNAPGVIAVTLAAITLTTPVGAQGREAGPAATVRRLLELTGAAQLALRGIEAMVPTQRAASSVFDWTDPDHPREIVYFDRGVAAVTDLAGAAR